MLLLDATLPNLVIIDSSPITHKEAYEMIDELRGAPILKGARGHKPSDISAVIEVLLRLSQLLIDFPRSASSISTHCVYSRRTTAAGYWTRGLWFVE